MTFVTARDLRLHPAQTWQKLTKEGELVVTLKGRPVGILARASGEELEGLLRAFRQARAAYAISKIREEAASSGVSRMTMAQIQREIDAVRRHRKASSR